MLLDFHFLFHKYNLKIKGVVEIGAHWGQEVVSFKQVGVNDIILIEPCSAAFNVLKTNYGNDPRIKLFNFACGNYNGDGQMNIERTNQGQSNSLLKPKVHLEQHKEVIFTGETENVIVRRLDDIEFDRSAYSFLNMDAQGFEAKILAGATETLKSIDYIYTEVNRLEMYEGNAMVEELDAILSDFTRVETGWASHYHGWGDSFFVRKTLL